MFNTRPFYLNGTNMVDAIHSSHLDTAVHKTPGPFGKQRSGTPVRLHHTDLEEP